MDTLRVLVVDDELGIRHSVSRALRDFTVVVPDVDVEVGFAVDSAASGEEALEKIDEQAPDVLLLDHQMGGMTGIEVIEQIAARELSILTVMITAFATISTAVRATKSGAFDFVPKPFTPAELKETVRKAAAHLMTQRRARQMAEEKRRVRFEFIRVLGHELKAPLGAVESYLTIIKNRTLGNELDAYDQMIDRCLIRTEGMGKLILDLLDMTRIESGQKVREVREINVLTLARSAVENVAPVATDRGIEVILHCEEDVLMLGDEGEIQIVLNNLVSNAVKYNRDGGRVDVRLDCDTESVDIAVSDTGFGLSSEDRSRLFNDFVRIKSENTRDIAGSGLGLSIVKKISDLYEGSCSVTSELGVGSTFSVSLNRGVSLENPNNGSRGDK